MIGHFYDGNERNGRLETIVAALETDYGDGGSGGTVPTGAANAILALNMKATPINGQVVERKIVQRYLGKAPGVRVGQHMSLDFEIELAGSGTAGVSPAYDAILRMGGLARTAITGLATIPATVTNGAGSVGRFTYAKTAKYAGKYPRTVTLTCTTGGGSGVAAFTVSAAATAEDTAVNVTAQVMTTASPFPLIEGAVITPSAIATNFQVGDTYTLALVNERVSYTPVSSGFESGAIYYEKDRVLYRGYGSRAQLGIKIAKDSFPVLTCKFACLSLPVTASSIAGADYSGWREPDVTARANVPVFELDGFAAIFQDFSADFANTAKYTSAANAEGIRIGSRSASATCNIDAPLVDDKNFYTLAAEENGPLPQWPAWLRHGTTAGNIVDFTAPNCQLEQIGEGSTSEDLPPQLALTLGLIPSFGVGNDEFALSFG